MANVVKAGLLWAIVPAVVVFVLLKDLAEAAWDIYGRADS